MVKKCICTIFEELTVSFDLTGLIKILKKYDKRTGGLLRLPFTQLAAHHPPFTTEPLARLVM